MKVTFLASTLRLGGAERVTGEVSRRLASRGFEITWALLREPGSEGERLRELGLDVTSQVAPARFDLLAAAKLARVFRRQGTEALYCLDHQNAVVLGALAARSAGVRRRFMAVHTTGLWGDKPSLPRGVRAVLKHYDRIIAVAELQARYLAEKEGVDPSRIIVIRNGIDVARYAPDGERMGRGQAYRGEYLNGGIGPLIGHVAALRPEKGHDVLFQAMGRLLQAHPGVRLALVGDGPERPRLEALAGQLGLGHAVRFLGARDDVADWLQAFDVVVLPSHPSVETLPLSLMEAMAAGRPVVASRVGSVEELVVDGVTGSLVPPGDVPGLSGALLRLIGDRRLREEYGRKGMERAKEFDIERTVEETARLLGGGT